VDFDIFLYSDLFFTKRPNSSTLLLVTPEMLTEEIWMEMFTDLPTLDLVQNISEALTPEKSSRIEHPYLDWQVISSKSLSEQQDRIRVLILEVGAVDLPKLAKDFAGHLSAYLPASKYAPHLKDFATIRCASEVRGLVIDSLADSIKRSRLKKELQAITYTTQSRLFT
jgi:hypothetical protein